MKLADVTLDIVESHHRVVITAVVLMFLVRAATQLVLCYLRKTREEMDRITDRG